MTANQSNSNEQKSQAKGNGQIATAKSQEDATANFDPPISVDYRVSLLPALARAGTLSLSAEESKALMAEFPSTAVKQRKFRNRNESYIDHTTITRRLNEVLGVGQWCCVRVRFWYDVTQSAVYASYVLVVRGVWVTDTVCSWEYLPSNQQANYDDCLEATRGVAIRRMAAKALSCGDQVWPHAISVGNETPSTATKASNPATPGATKPTHTEDEIAKAISFMSATASHGMFKLQQAWEAMPNTMRKIIFSKLEEWKTQAEIADQVATQHTDENNEYH